MIFQSVYNGPLQYFARIIREEEIFIERLDHYIKQTYRNRCKILGANGPLSLSIPVTNISGEKTLMKDVKIDYAVPWQKNHWKSIESAYASSPFFEFVMDDFVIFYEKQTSFLIDLNHSLLEAALSILNVDCRISYSEEFSSIDSDPEFIIHPKKDFRKYDPIFQPETYNQVFIEKHSFVPNLSILDLLFNEGSNAKTILVRSIRT